MSRNYAPYNVLLNCIGAFAIISATALTIRGVISEPESTVSLWVKGACAKEFMAEAAQRGHRNIDRKTLALSADRPHGNCKAAFVVPNGNQISFSWKANQGGHIPVPLADPMKATGTASPGASAPSQTP